MPQNQRRLTISRGCCGLCLGMELFAWRIAALPGGNGVLLGMDFIYQVAASYGHEDGNANRALFDFSTNIFDFYRKFDNFIDRTVEDVLNPRWFVLVVWLDLGHRVRLCETK